MPTEKNRMKNRLFSVVTSLLVIVIFLAACEIVCRFLVSPDHKFQWPYEETARNTLYRFDPHLGWFPKESHGDWFEGSVRFWVQNNSEGFRDVEHDLSKQEKPRLAVLGDSYVWGYDVEAEDRFTEILRERIPEIEIFNCGVGGYGTCQERVLYLEKVRKYQPDVVLLAYSGNDRANNLRAIAEGGYARPHYRLKGGQLVLENLPLPKMIPYYEEAETVGYFYRCHLWDSLRYAFMKLRIKLEKDPTEALVVALGEDVAQDGAKYLVAIRANDTDVEEYCKEHGVECFMVSQYLQDRSTPEDPVRFTEHGRHWTPKGHRLVAEFVEPIVRSAFGLVEGATPEARGGEPNADR